MSKIEKELIEVLEKYLGSLVARAVARVAFEMSDVNVERLRPGDDLRLLSLLERSVKRHASSVATSYRCMDDLKAVLTQQCPVVQEKNQQITVPIREESDIVRARGLGRDLCASLGYSSSLQIKVATVISELARNIVLYAKEGEVILRQNMFNSNPCVEIKVKDNGPGIPNIDAIMSGKYRSKSGLGLGLLGSKRLANSFEIVTAPGKGTEVTVRFLGR